MAGPCAPQKVSRCGIVREKMRISDPENDTVRCPEADALGTRIVGAFAVRKRSCLPDQGAILERPALQTPALKAHDDVLPNHLGLHEGGIDRLRYAPEGYPCSKVDRGFVNPHGVGIPPLVTFQVY
jgi:hypothetical protein